MANPETDSLAHPKSREKAMRAMCYQCMGRATTWLKDVEECTAPTCALYNLRPRQKAPRKAVVSS